MSNVTQPLQITGFATTGLPSPPASDDGYEETTNHLGLPSSRRALSDTTAAIQSRPVGAISEALGRDEMTIEISNAHTLYEETKRLLDRSLGWIDFHKDGQPPVYRTFGRFRKMLKEVHRVGQDALSGGASFDRPRLFTDTAYWKNPEYTDELLDAVIDAAHPRVRDSILKTVDFLHNAYLPPHSESRLPYTAVDVLTAALNRAAARATTHEENGAAEEGRVEGLRAHARGLDQKGENSDEAYDELLSARQAASDGTYFAGQLRKTCVDLERLLALQG